MRSADEIRQAHDLLELALQVPNPNRTEEDAKVMYTVVGTLKWVLECEVVPLGPFLAHIANHLAAQGYVEIQVPRSRTPRPSAN